MNNSDGKIWYGLGIDTTDIQRDSQKVNDAFMGIGDKAQAEGSRIENSFSRAGGMLTGILSAAVITGFAKKMFEVRSEFQDAESSMRVFLGSAEKASTFMKELQDYAWYNMFEFKDLTGESAKLLAFGNAVEDVIPIIDQLSNIASGTKGNLSELVDIYNKAKSIGKVDARMLESLGAKGVVVTDVLKQMGVQVDRSAIKFEHLQMVLEHLTSEGGMFYGLMAEMMDNLSASAGQLQDNIAIMLNEIGEKNQDAMKAGIDAASYLVDNYEKLGKIISGLIITYGAYKTAVLVLSTVQKIHTSIQLESALAGRALTVSQGLQALSTKALTGAWLKLSKTMLANPFVLITTLVVGFAAAMWALSDRTTTAEKALKAYNDEKEKAAELEAKHKQEVDKLIESSTNQALADADRVAALQSLKLEYPKIFKEYDIEKLKLADILSIKKEIAEEDLKRKVQKNIDSVAEIDAKIDRAEKAYALSVKNGTSGYSLASQLEYIDYLKEKRKPYLKDIDTDSANAFLSGITGISNTKLEAEIKRREKLLTQLTGGKTHGKITGLGTFSKDEIQAQLDSLRTEMNVRNRETFTGNQLLAKANAELKKLTTERAKILTSKLTPEESKQQLEDIDAQIKAVQETIKSYSGDTKAAEKRKELLAEITKGDLEQLRWDEEFRLKKEEAEISLWEEGTEKELALIELAYRRKILAINRQEEDLLRVIQEQAEKRAQAEGNASFKKSDVELTQEQKDLFESLRDTTQFIYEKDQSKSFGDLIKKYQDFATKRLEIEKKFRDELAVLEAGKKTDGADIDRIDASIKVLKQQQETELNALDLEIAHRTEVFKAWVNKITTLGLQELVDALEAAKDTLSTSDVSDEDKAVLRAKIETLQNQIKVLQARDSSGSNEWTATLKTMNEVNESIRNIINGFDGLDEATKSILTAATNISGAIITSIAGIIALSVTGTEAIKSVERASVILAIIGAAISVITIIINLFTSAARRRKQEEEEALERQRQEYFGLLDYNNELEKKYEWVKKIGEAELDFIKRKGQELDKQRKDNEKEQADLYAKLQNEKYRSGQVINKGWFKTTTTDVYSTLAGKTYEEIAELAAQGKLSKEAEKYFEYLKKAKEEGADIERMQLDYIQSLKELATGTTAQSITDSIIEGFKAGKRTAADFADTFEKLMQGAVQSALRQMTDKKVLDWYDKFYQYSKDGLTESKKEELRADWNQLISDTAKDALNLESITGTSISEKDNREGAKKGFGSMSQDSADELNGRFTALQGLTINILDGVRVLQANSSQALKHLAGIETNTARLEKIETTIGWVKSGIDDTNSIMRKAFL